MPLLASLFFVSILGLLGALYVPSQKAVIDNALADSSATSFLAYRESVINYMNINPTFVGTVPDTSLVFLWGYTRDPRWTNVSSGGSLYVYEAVANSPNTSMMLDRLYFKTAKSFMVGRNVSNVLVPANGFANGVSVPSVVPNGALLMVGK